MYTEQLDPPKQRSTNLAALYGTGYVPCEYCLMPACYIDMLITFQSWATVHLLCKSLSMLQEGREGHTAITNPHQQRNGRWVSVHRQASVWLQKQKDSLISACLCLLILSCTLILSRWRP
jgi:hypothetical protein